MKKHLTPESNYIPYAAALKNLQMTVIFGVQALRPAGQVEPGGYVCQGAMTK